MRIENLNEAEKMLSTYKTNKLFDDARLVKMLNDMGIEAKISDTFKGLYYDKEALESYPKANMPYFVYLQLPYMIPVDKKSDENSREFAGLTMAQVAHELGEDFIQCDVFDTELTNMETYFNYDLGDNRDVYFHFLGVLANNVIVDSISDYGWTCDFSGYLKPFNAELIKLREDNGWSIIKYDGDKTYLDYVLWFEDLIKGDELDDNVYREITNVLEYRR